LFRSLPALLAWLLLAAAVACGSDRGPSPTPSASVSSSIVPSETILPTPTLSVTPSATPIRTPTIYPSPPPVPNDWQTYADPSGFYTVKYPPDWFTQVEGPTYVAIYPFNPAITTAGPGGSVPGSVKVESGREDIAQSAGCGSAQMKDPATGEMVVQPGAAPWTLSAMPAYLFVYAAGEGEGGFTLAPSVSTIYKGTCFFITAYFSEPTPDVQTFLQIAESFQFTY